MLMERVFCNLIENAAKYGGGSVFVTVSGQAGFVELMIEDDGVGIPEEDRIRIFDRGVRLDSGKPGTGLGLAISKSVIEKHGGKIWVESKPGKGARFCFALPAAKARSISSGGT